MIPATVKPRQRINAHGQVYVHVYGPEMHIFNLTDDVAPKVIALPRRLDSELRTDQAAKILRHLGWGVGIDGWRAPLSPKSGIIATAHLYPLDELWRYGA